jgi:hypothetical protein
MDNKIKLIEIILKNNILNNDYYGPVFKVFEKEFGINLFQTNHYDSEINTYKANLISRLSEYLNRIYSLENLMEMSLDLNSPLYHRMLVQEYHDIIFGETRVFSINLRNRFIEDGITKQTLLQKIVNFFFK